MVESADPTSIRSFYPIDSFGLGTLSFDSSGIVWWSCSSYGNDKNHYLTPLPFCWKKLHLHQRVDKIELCEEDFLVKLTVLFARDGVNEEIKGGTADKKQPLPYNLGSIDKMQSHTCLTSGFAKKENEFTGGCYVGQEVSAHRIYPAINT
jgi:hypothetical protein